MGYWRAATTARTEMTSSKCRQCRTNNQGYFLLIHDLRPREEDDILIRTRSYLVISTQNLAFEKFIFDGRGVSMIDLTQPLTPSLLPYSLKFRIYSRQSDISQCTN